MQEFTLLARLLAGDGQRVLEWVGEGAGAAAQLRLAGPAGLTAMHAAVLGRCGGAVVAALAAAGVPLDAALDDSIALVLRDKPLGRLLHEKLGWRCDQVVRTGAIPLGIATEMQDAEAVAQLLEAGADPWAPCAGHYPTVLAAAASRSSPVAAAFLAHLERRRGASGLHGMGGPRALVLLEAAAVHGHVALAAHAAAELEPAHGVPAGQEGRGVDENALRRVIVAAARSTHTAAADVLRALLHSRLPFELAPASSSYLSLLALAAEGGPVEEKVRVLHATGAPLTAQALLQAIEAGPRCMAALLALGCPPADTSSVTGIAGGRVSYSCPVHRTLHKLASGHCTNVDALRTLEALLAAGYRPTVWHNVPAPGMLCYCYDAETTVPSWLRRAVPRERMLLGLDPFDFYTAGLSCRVLFVARGGKWSPGTHHLWPPAFKAAARTLLLASARSSSPLGPVPGNAVLRVLELAALPMSAWVGPDGAGW